MMRTVLLAAAVLLAPPPAYADLFTVSGGNLTGTLFITDSNVSGNLFIALPPPPANSLYAGGQVNFIQLATGSTTVGGFEAWGSGVGSRADLTFSGSLVGYAGGFFGGQWMEDMETCYGTSCDDHWVPFSAYGTATPVNQTPLPAALPLFAGGLALLVAALLTGSAFLWETAATFFGFSLMFATVQGRTNRGEGK